MRYPVSPTTSGQRRVIEIRPVHTISATVRREGASGSGVNGTSGKKVKSVGSLIVAALTQQCLAEVFTHSQELSWLRPSAVVERLLRKFVTWL